MASNFAKLTSEFAREFKGLCVPWQAAAVQNPEIVWVNESLAAELGIDLAWLKSAQGVDWLIGQSPAEGTIPVAQVYAGHQFGHYAPRLGDGRALLLGEITSLSGQLFDVHLKGSGPTPFSRGGDGFAALGPMLREAIMGESMHALGIETSRALAVVKTDRWLSRDGGIHPAAILTRVAPSYLRVGTFEYARNTGDKELLVRLAEYALERHYTGVEYLGTEDAAFEDAAVEQTASEQTAGAASRGQTAARALLQSVVSGQAKLVAKWMLVGFVHGVINTDNVTISGTTIDYGPCAMIDYFEADAVFSSIDHAGRYSYKNQPGVMQWNLARFAEALLPLLADEQSDAVAYAEAEVQKFAGQYEAAYNAGLEAKLNGADVSEVLRLRDERLDFTDFFRQFSDQNPLYIARNHLVASALEAAEEGNIGEFEVLMRAVSDPHTKHPELSHLEGPPAPDAPSFVTMCGT